jgi:hypothetical protein
MDKFSDFDFSELEKKFAKKKFDRNKAVKAVVIDDLVKMFTLHFLNYFYVVPLSDENKLLYQKNEFINMNSKEKKDEKFDVKLLIQSLIFIISKLGYAPFSKYNFIFIKDFEKYSLYYDVTFFIKQTLNFFNFICAPHIYEFLKFSTPNNFVVRLEKYGLKITQGREYLFTKSYVVVDDPDDKKILSSCVSQLRNFLYAMDNDDKILLDKIKWDQFNNKFIKYSLEVKTD